MRLPLALALTAGLVLAQAGAAHATSAGRDGRIAFWDFNTRQIYAVNPDGTGLAQLTHVAQGQTAADPAWSPDGRHIAFDSDMSGAVRLWIMDANGSHAHMVAGDRPNFADLQPTFTPDGRQLVFSRCIMGDQCAIYSIQVDGTHLRALTRLRHITDAGASVSPDGTQIAFGRGQAHGIIGQIYVMNANGSGAHAVTPPVLEGVGPRWSPDGKLITFTSNCCRPGSNIYVMHPDGTGIRRLTHTPSLHDSFQSAYAPQGDRIVFASDRLHADFCCNDLFVMRSNGTQETLVHTGLTGVLSPPGAPRPCLRRRPPPVRRPLTRPRPLGTGGRMARGAGRFPKSCRPKRSAGRAERPDHREESLATDSSMASLPCAQEQPVNDRAALRHDVRGGTWVHMAQGPGLCACSHAAWPRVLVAPSETGHHAADRHHRFGGSGCWRRARPDRVRR